MCWQVADVNQASLEGFKGQPYQPYVILRVNIFNTTMQVLVNVLLRLTTTHHVWKGKTHKL